MVPYFGDFAEDATVYIPFNTFSSDDPAASVTATDLVDADVKVHKDGSATQIVTDGATVAIDFDSVTGNHLITIDTSVHADYATGSDYLVRIEGVTVDAGTVNAFVGQFSIENRHNEVDVVKWLGTAAATPTIAGVPEVDITHVGGATTNVAAMATNVDAILADTGTDGVLLAGTATSAQLVDDVWDEATSDHNTGGTTGKALRNAGGIVLHAGTADAGGATTIDLETGSAVATDDYYNHTVVILTGGTGAGQERLISDYTGSSQQATITPAWAVNPDATSEYEIIPGTVHAETQGGGYAGGAVWIGPSGSTGAQLYVDGTVDNPIDDGQMANAKTVADALNLRIFRVEPTSSITLGETLNGYTIEGIEYTLNLGTQDVSNTYIKGASLAASTATGSGTIFDNCIFDNAVTLAPCVIRNSYLGDTTITAGSAGSFFVNHCVSRAAGNAVSPNFDFGAALNASNLNIRDWSGGIELENMGAGTGTYNCSIEGQGNVIINANCSATSNLAIRGAFTYTDNAGGAVTLSDDARIDVAQINAEADTALTDIGLDHLVSASVTGTDITDDSIVAKIVSSSATADWDDFVNTTDSLQAVRDHIGDGTNLSEAGGTGDHLTALPWNAAWDAEVESEVNDAIDTAIAELGVGAPTATPTLRTGMMLMYMSLRNKLVVQTSGTDALEVYNDAGTKIASKAITDDGSDYTEAEMVSG